MTLDTIPAYDPTQEKRKHVKTGEIITEGIWVGTGERRRLVNPEIIWMMAEMGSSDGEIADWLGIDSQALRYNFQSYLTKARSNLKFKLRRAMVRNALDGQASIQIFLAKNFLGMSDAPLVSEDTKVLPWHTPDTTDSDAEINETE